MKIEEYVPEAESIIGLNTTVRIPFVLRTNGKEPYFGREEKISDAREFGKPKEMATTQEMQQITEEMGIAEDVLFDDEATATMIAKQGLIREYTENLKQVNLQNLEQVMQELHQDRMLQKYQYFVREV